MVEHPPYSNKKKIIKKHGTKWNVKIIKLADAEELFKLNQIKKDELTMSNFVDFQILRIGT